MPVTGTSAPTAVVTPSSSGGQVADLLPADVYVEVDLDPTFADLVSDAYLYARIFIPASVKPDLAANAGSISGFIQSDDFSMGIHSHGGGTLWDWWAGSGAGTDFAPVTFDDWTEIEVHAIAGASTYDVRIDGVLYTAIPSAFLPATGINWWSVGSLPADFVGDGGGSTADDTIQVDQLAWSVVNWVSLGGTVFARWAFDGADPIGDALANYPDPPWAPWENGDPANIVIESGGGEESDLSPGESEGEEPDPPPDPIGCCADAAELAVRVFIGGTEVTGNAVAGSWTPRLNRPAQATVTLPLDSAIGDVGDLLRIEYDTEDACIVFHGRILNRSLDTAKDDGRVQYNAQDGMELWQARVVRDDTADFSKPQVIADYLKAPAIMRAILRNTEGNSTAQGNPLWTPPGTAEGPLGIIIGGIATGGPDLDGAPVDWPMKISEMFSLLVSTGQLDGILSYVNPGGGITAQVDFYNGDYGTDRTADVVFQYGMGAFNVDSLRWNRDMTQVINKYQLFGGPSITTAADPAGDQHWCFNVTGDDPNLASPPGGDVNAPYDGGGGNPPGDPGNELGGRRLDSQAAYDVRMQVDIVDGYDDDCIPGFGAPGRDLWRHQWQTYSWLAAMPRDIIHITPVPGAQIGCFGIGDLIQVEAVGDVLGGFAGAQRVYGYTVSWEATPSVLTLSEIETSADNEGQGT